jgi:hypothetical protein
MKATAGSVCWSCGKRLGIIVSVPPRWLAGDGSTVASTLPPAAARAVGSLPVAMDRTEPACGSMRKTLPPGPFATQMASSA